MSTKCNIKEHLQNAEEQKELFLWKYRDVSRTEVSALFSDFQRFDKENTGEITEHEAILLLEFRGATKTATELRSMIHGMMITNKSHKLSFLEWCCAYFEKSYDDLNEFADEEARDLALAEARQVEQVALAAEREIQLAKEAEEQAAVVRAEELERESKLTGVAGMKAFFHRQVEGATDNRLTNEQKIREEATRRKVLRDAKLKLNAALEEANKIKSAEDIHREMQKKVMKAAAEAAAVAAQAAEEERATRAARKAALNAKWGGGLPPPPPKR